MEKTMEKIVALAKARGFVYPGSEIYGGLANTWDYGNLGVELKNNVKQAWWKKFVTENPHNVGVDCAILMNPQTWVASGHLGGFSDPLMDCRDCHERFRADKLIEDFAEEKGLELNGSVDGWSQEQMVSFIEEHQIPCPTCGKHNFTDIRQFNLMFKTFQGVTEDAKNTVYLRPETAQGIFVNFKNGVERPLKVHRIIDPILLRYPRKLASVNTLGLIFGKVHTQLREPKTKLTAHFCTFLKIVSEKCRQSKVHPYASLSFTAIRVSIQCLCGTPLLLQSNMTSSHRSNRQS